MSFTSQIKSYLITATFATAVTAQDVNAGSGSGDEFIGLIIGNMLFGSGEHLPTGNKQITAGQDFKNCNIVNEDGGLNRQVMVCFPNSEEFDFIYRSNGIESPKP